MGGDGQFISPRGIAVGPSGQVYAADRTHGIQALDSDGQFLASWDLGAWAPRDRPDGIAVGPTGIVYITGRHQVELLSKKGETLATWGTKTYGGGDRRSNPSGTAVGPNGKVYVVDTGNLRVQMFEADGTFICKWGIRGIAEGYLGNPQWMAIDASGDLYFNIKENADFDLRPTPSELQPG